MKFPSAAKGVKKIFTAEILSLISTLCLIVGAVMMIFALPSLSEISEFNDLFAAEGSFLSIALITLAAFAVLSFIAFILHLVGIINAMHDESNFKSALIFLLIGIVTNIIIGIVMYNNQAPLISFLSSFEKLMSVISTIFVIAGGVKLADKLNRGDVSTKGSNVLKLILVINLLVIVINIVTGIMGGLAANITTLILFIVVLVLIIIQYIMYLSFLSKLKKMLCQS